jgi:transcriptional regulator with XRE-family HTH domain
MRSARRRPKRLAEKLLQIRLALGLSQNELVRTLDLDNEIGQSKISSYERGTREPRLHILLRYSHAAGVYMGILVDDELDLPVRLPSNPKRR